MGFRGPVVLALALAGASTPVAVAANSHCANEEPLYASKRIVIARELTESSDIYVTCWRRTNKHRVVAKFPAQERQSVAFGMKGEWVVWRYRRSGDRMGSMNARTGMRGPAVTVQVAPRPFLLGAMDGPVAQDVGDADVLFVFIGSNGYYAWPVVGELPLTEGGGSATAMYEANGTGGDVRIDVGAGSMAFSKVRIRGTTLRWANHGMARHTRLGPLTPA
jgi:hypothetical protein